MIRKVLFSFFLVSTIAWFAIAYVVKNNIVNLIANSESDNVKILYDSIKVSGYPGRWKINIIEPKVKFIDHLNSREFLYSDINVVLSFSLKKAIINLGKEVKYVENYDNQTSEYLTRSDEDIKWIIKFNKPLYRTPNKDNLSLITKSMQLNNTSLSVVNAEKELFNIKDLSIVVNKSTAIQEESFLLLLNLVYSSEENFLNFKNANLNLATSIKFALENDSSMLKEFIINRLVFMCDDDNTAAIEVNGGLQFIEDKLPQGKFSFEVANYNSIIDRVVPTNILFSKKMIKTIIAKSINPASASTDGEGEKIEKVKFDLEFSEKGIHIGSINLLELTLGADKPSEDTVGIAE